MFFFLKVFIYKNKILYYLMALQPKQPFVQLSIHIQLSYSKQYILLGLYEEWLQESGQQFVQALVELVLFFFYLLHFWSSSIYLMHTQCQQIDFCHQENRHVLQNTYHPPHLPGILVMQVHLNKLLWNEHKQCFFGS